MHMARTPLRTRILACVLAFATWHVQFAQSCFATSALATAIAPVGILSLLLSGKEALAQPVDFGPATSQGSAAARGAAGGVMPPSVSASGAVTFNSSNAAVNGLTMTGEQLVPGSSDPGKRAASDANISRFGDKSGTNSASSTASSTLMMPGTDPYANAYQTIRGRAVQNAHPKLTNEPIANVAKSVRDGTDTNGFVASITAACQTTTTTEQRRTHSPDYRTCERTAEQTGGCRVTRSFKQYTNVIETPIFHYQGVVEHQLVMRIKLRYPDFRTFSACGDNAALADAATAAGIDFTTVEEAIAQFDGCAEVNTILEENFPVVGPNAISSTSIEITNTGTPMTPPLQFVTAEEPTPDNDWTTTVTIAHWNGGATYADVTGRLTIRYVEPLDIVDEPLGCSTPVGSCSFDSVPWAPTATENDQASTDSWRCLNASSDRIIGSVHVTPDHWPKLAPLYPGEPTGPGVPICYDAEARSYQCHYAAAPFPVDTCAPLETSPTCAFIRSECLPENIDGPTGRCAKHTFHYDCGTDTLGPRTDVTTTTCAGPVRCMGLECVEPQPKEANTDFDKAAAQLGMTQWMDMDKECAASGDCRVFIGQGLACRNVFWGTQNCCDQPVNTTLADYIKLTYYTYKVTNWSAVAQVMENAGLGQITSGAQALGDFVSSTWSDISQPIISAWQDLAGDFSSSISEAFESFTADTIKETAKEYLIDWGQSVFGESFATYGGEAMVSSMVDGASQIIGPIMTFMMYYAIAMILISIIWACEDREFELSQKRQMKTCHALGSYCSARFLGICYETSNSFCCYASPLARIIQEQVRAQLGLGWPGAGYSPTCPGLTVAQLQSVDWNRIDLSEWISYLELAGLHPSSPAVADSMYAPGRSTTYINAPGTQGMSATQMTQEAIGAPNTPMQSVNNVSTNMWGNLP